MVALTKYDISLMENEDKKYSRGDKEIKHKNKHSHKKSATKTKKDVGLYLLRGASPNILKYQFEDDIDE